jgi:hypothetical protein
MIKERLIAVLQKNATGQMAMYLSVLVMAVSSMEDDQVIAMLRDIRSLLDELLEGD